MCYKQAGDTSSYAGAGRHSVGVAAGPDGNLWFAQGMPNMGQITPMGKVTEFAQPAGGDGTQGITAGPECTVWFADIGAERIGKIS